MQAEHRARRWSGDARRFGDGAAILIGDLSFVYADMLLSHLGPRGWQMWNELRVELNIGQYLDMLGSAQNERRPEKAAWAGLKSQAGQKSEEVDLALLRTNPVFFQRSLHFNKGCK